MSVSGSTLGINVLEFKQRTVNQSQMSNGEVSAELRALLSKITKLYAKVFAGPPWNEYKVCKQEHYTSKEDGDRTQCNVCQGDLSPAYPESKVLDKIFSAVGNPKGGFLTFFEDSNGDPQAVGWGFVCSIQELKDFYRSSDMRTKVEEKIAGFMQGGNIFYISEVFVDPVFQNQRLGTKITQTLVDRATELKLNIVIRTHDNSPMATIAARKLAMDRILNTGEDIDYQNRILFAKKLSASK